eukprot:COSAG05_NODE_629_length_8215_cov_26.328241_7_plen_123_part_00
MRSSMGAWVLAALFLNGVACWGQQPGPLVKPLPAPMAPRCAAASSTTIELSWAAVAGADLFDVSIDAADDVSTRQPFASLTSPRTEVRVDDLEPQTALTRSPCACTRRQQRLTPIRGHPSLQ